MAFLLSIESHGNDQENLRAETRRGSKLLAQPSQGQSTQRQAEVAQGNVIKTRNQEQVQNDSPKPEGNHGGADLRFKGDQNPGDDFNGADDQHETVRGQR